jgi:hypothetical protein
MHFRIFVFVAYNLHYRYRSWRMPSSGMWRRVGLLWTNVSEEHVASIFSVEEIVNPHGDTSQKTAFFLVTAVKTSTPTLQKLYASSNLGFQWAMDEEYSSRSKLVSEKKSHISTEQEVYISFAAWTQLHTCTYTLSTYNILGSELGREW